MITIKEEQELIGSIRKLRNFIDPIVNFNRKRPVIPLAFSKLPW